MPNRPPPPCRQPGCPNLRPCPTNGHEPKPWSNTTRRANLTLSGSAEQKRAKRILRRDHHTCHICHLDHADTVDHITPLAEGGPDDDTNLAAIHAVPCHEQKTNAEAARARARRPRGLGL